MIYQEQIKRIFFFFKIIYRIFFGFWADRKAPSRFISFWQGTYLLMKSYFDEKGKKEKIFSRCYERFLFFEKCV